MNNKKLKLITLSTIFVACTFTLAGCGKNLSVDEYLIEAEQYIEKGDTAKGILFFKNAVRLEPKNAAIRFALGSVYLDEGDLYSAEKELEKSRELGSKELLLIPKLAKVKMLLNKYSETYEIADNSAILKDEQYIMVLTYAGLAALSEGRVDLAEGYINQASILGVDSLYSQVGSAWLNFSNDKFTEVEATLNLILSKSEKFSEALLLSGHLNQSQFKYEKAIEMYSAFLKQHPLQFQVKLYLINSFLSAEKFDEAEKELSLLNQVYKKHPIVSLYNAQVEYHKKDFIKAKQFSEQAINLNDTLYMGQLIAGMSAFKLGELELAYRHLSRIGPLLPSNNGVKKLLAMLELQLGFDTEAESSFENMQPSSINDIEILNAASRAFAKKGNNEVAERLLDKIVKANPDNDQVALEFSALKVANGNKDELDVLEELAKNSDNSTDASFVLVTHYINNKDYDNAFRVAKNLQNNDTTKVKGLLIEGFIYARKGDESKASDLFREVIEIDKLNIPAYYYLGEFAYNNKKWDEAKSLYVKILEIEPLHRASVSRLTYINIRLNKQKETINYLNALRVKFPENEDILIDLALNYSASGKVDEGIKLLAESDVKSQSPRYKLVLAKFYESQNKLNKAKELYLSIIDSSPTNQDIWFELVMIEQKLGNVESALTVVTSALNNVTNKEKLQILKAKLLLSLDRYSSANNLITSLYEEYPDNLNVRYLAAQLDLAKGDMAKARVELDSLYKAKPNSELAIKLAQAYVKDDLNTQAIDVLEQHGAKYGFIGATKALLAELLLTESPEKSKDIYLELNELYPNNLAVLNNLSLANYNLGNIEEALKFGKLVFNVKQTSSTIDTYAKALIANGNESEVIDIIKSVKDKSLLNDNLKLTLIESYIATDQMSLAKEELERITTVDDKFSKRYSAVKSKL